MVLLEHGLMSSSEVFVMNSELSLAVQLARNGYDVWLLNSRGSIYSRGHATKYAMNDYFDYSFYEIGKYDLTESIDYVKT